MRDDETRPLRLPDRSAVHSDPEIHSGEPVFVRTRVPVQSFLEYLEGGYSLDEFLDQLSQSSTGAGAWSRRPDAAASSPSRLDRLSTRETRSRADLRVPPMLNAASTGCAARPRSRRRWPDNHHRTG